MPSSEYSIRNASRWRAIDTAVDVAPKQARNSTIAGVNSATKDQYGQRCAKRMKAEAININAAGTRSAAADADGGSVLR